MKSFCVLVFSLQLVCGQYSTTPCPGVFDFEDDGHHVYGVITLRPVAPVSSLELRINFTVAAKLIDNNYSGRIDSVNSKTLLQRYNQGQAVSYLIHFPVTSPLPKLTALTVNGDTICNGPGDLVRGNAYVTTLSLQHSSFLEGGAGAAPVFNNFQLQPQTRPQPQPQDAIRQAAVNHIHIGEDDATAHIHTFKNIEPALTTGTIANNHQLQPQTSPQDPIRKAAVNHIHIGEDDATAHIHTFKNIEPALTTGTVANDHQLQPQTSPQDPIRKAAVNHIHIGEDDATAHIHTFKNIESTLTTGTVANDHQLQPQTSPQDPIRKAAVNHIHIGEDDATAHIHTFKKIEPALTTGKSPNHEMNNPNPCPKATQQYLPLSQQIFPSRRTYKYDEPPVTRSNPNDYNPPSQSTAVSAISNRFSNTSDETIECGTVSGGNIRIPLIYNGKAYDRGELPWLVAIYKSEQPSLRFICGGTLVSDRHIVTAAQCIQRRGTLTSIKDIVVKVGVHNLNDWSDDITIIRSLQAATVHEAYNPATLQNDILVLTLDKPVKFNDYIRPACLWSGNTDLSVVVGKKGVVAGWGEQGVESIGSQGEPHKVDVPIVSSDDCRASKALFHELTFDNILCAGDRQGSGPCVGDSGGGMYLLQDGKWRVRGVVSVALHADNGNATCNLNEYVVFTDTAQFLPWIKNILAQN